MEVSGSSGVVVVVVVGVLWAACKDELRVHCIVLYILEGKKERNRKRNEGARKTKVPANWTQTLRNGRPCWPTRTKLAARLIGTTMLECLRLLIHLADVIGPNNCARPVSLGAVNLVGGLKSEWKEKAAAAAGKEKHRLS